MAHHVQSIPLELLSPSLVSLLVENMVLHLENLKFIPTQEKLFDLIEILLNFREDSPYYNDAVKEIINMRNNS